MLATINGFDLLLVLVGVAAAIILRARAVRIQGELNRARRILAVLVKEKHILLAHDERSLLADGPHSFVVSGTDGRCRICRRHVGAHLR